MSMKSLVVAAALAAAVSVFADTYTVADGATQTLTSITNTTRFTKAGGGTLVLSGTNLLTTMTVSAGTLNIHGGTTTFGDASATSADGNGLFQGRSHVTIDGGATVTATAGTYIMQLGGNFTVENATFDATAIGGHFMNGFTTSPSTSFDYSRIIIGNGGVFKTKILRPVGSRSGTDATKENFSVDLNAGGNLYVNQFWEDNGSRYARINFNGGVLHIISGSNSELFNSATTNPTWTQDMVTPTVLAGGAYIDNQIVNTIYPAFKSGVAEGETDGGLHHRGNTVLYWRAKNSTYNGGTWLESNGGGNFAVSPAYGDSVFGAVPATPTTNIWVTGSYHKLFNEWGTFTTHPNRTVFIKDGKGFLVAAQGGAKLVIGGEIKGEITEGNEYPVGTYLESLLEWAGTEVLDPGEGRTNDVGRLVVKGHLEIASGVTRLTTKSGGVTGTSAPLYVLGVTNGYDATKGNLTISGGELYLPQPRYMEVSRYAQVNVVGGKFNAPSAEFLLGLATGGVSGLKDPGATLSVSNGGEFAVNIFRLGQGKGNPNFINLGKGGTIRANLLSCEFANEQNVTFNFDGGRFQSNASADGSSTLFNSVSNAKWSGVKFYVRKGGAILDSSNGKHCWWARPLLCGVEEGETDGGLNVVVRSDKAVVLCNDAVCTYNGPTRATTVGSRGDFQCRVANALPATTTLQVGPDMNVGFNGGWSASSSDLDQTVARVEGVGNVVYCSKLVVTSGISPVFDGTYGTLAFGRACSISGDYEIVGDTNGCGCVKFNQNQDISHLKLKIAAGATLDATKAKGSYYKIVDAPNGVTGEFDKSDLPSSWDIKYSADGVYLRYLKGTKIVVR